MTKYVDIVFDGPPDHEAGRFVEAEDDKGNSIRFARWLKRDDGYWVIRLKPHADDLKLPPTKRDSRHTNRKRSLRDEV